MIEARIREAERMEIAQEQIDFLRTVSSQLSAIDPSILDTRILDRSMPPDLFSEVVRNVLIDLIDLFLKSKTFDERTYFLGIIRRVHTEKKERKSDFRVSDYHQLCCAICPQQSHT